MPSTNPPARIPSVFALAAGPHLTSYAYFAVVATLALANNLFLANDLQGAPVAGRVLAVLAAELMQVLIIGATYFLNRRAGTPIKPIPFALVFLAAGALRGAFLEYLLQTLHFTASVNYGYRIWVGATNFGLSAWAWAVVFGLAAEFANQTRSLNAQRAHLAALQTEVDDKVSAATEFEINAFREYLLANLKLKKGSDPTSVRIQLQHAIESVIQPVVEQMLSRRTAVSAATDLTQSTLADNVRINLGNVLKNVTVRSSIRPLIQALLPLAAAAPSAISIYGWDHGPYVLFAMSVIWPVLLWIAKRTVAPAIDRLALPARLIGVVVVFTVTISPAMYLATVYPTSGGGAFVAPMIWLYAVMIGLVAGLWRSYEKELNRVYATRNSYLQQIRWKVAEVNSRSWHQQLHFARRVHGSLQSEVAAMAIRLDKLVTEAGGNPAQIERLRARLEDRVRQIFEAPDKFTNLADVLTEIAETWDGICQVTVHLTDGDAADIARDQIAVETLLEIAREGVSNAIRHGGAQNIDVRVRLLDETLVRILVTNDGKPLAAKADGEGRRGMGSKHLEECTVDYSVTVEDKQTVLLADVPYRG